MRSTNALLSSAESGPGMNCITAGSRLMTANGSRSCACQGRRINRSVLRTVVVFIQVRNGDSAIVNPVGSAFGAKNPDSPYNRYQGERRHSASVHGCERHHASAARGDGSDASVLDG